MQLARDVRKQARMPKLEVKLPGFDLEQVMKQFVRESSFFLSKLARAG